MLFVVNKILEREREIESHHTALSLLLLSRLGPGQIPLLAVQRVTETFLGVTAPQAPALGPRQRVEGFISLDPGPLLLRPPGPTVTLCPADGGIFLPRLRRGR